MPEKMTEAEFQELICDLWIKEGEKWKKITKSNIRWTQLVSKHFLGALV